MPHPAEFITGEVPRIAEQPSLLGGFWQEILESREDNGMASTSKSISRQAIVASGLRGMSPPWAHVARSPRERLAIQIAQNGGSNG